MCRAICALFLRLGPVDALWTYSVVLTSAHTRQGSILVCYSIAVHLPFKRDTTVCRRVWLLQLTFVPDFGSTITIIHLLFFPLVFRSCVSCWESRHHCMCNMAKHQIAALWDSTTNQRSSQVSSQRDPLNEKHGSSDADDGKWRSASNETTLETRKTQTHRTLRPQTARITTGNYNDNNTLNPLWPVLPEDILACVALASPLQLLLQPRNRPPLT